MADFGYADAFPLPEEPPQAQGPLFDGAPGMSFAAMQQPLPPEVERMAQPAKNPQEVEVRKQGWMQVVQRISSDPTLMRAVGMFGASMTQPMGMGETGIGRFAQSAMLGATAYDYGKEAERNRARQGEQDVMHRQRHDIALRQGQAGIESSQASTEQQRAQTRVTVATEADAIQRVRLERERTEQLIAAGKTTAEKEKIALDRMKKEQATFDSLPEHLKTQAAAAELQKPTAELARIGASTAAQMANVVQSQAAAGASSAAAQRTRALAGQEELELKDLQAMTPEERRAAQARKGGGAVSAKVQEVELYKELLRGSNLALSEQEINARGAELLANRKGDPFTDYMTFKERDPPANIVDPKTKKKRLETDAEHHARFLEIQKIVSGRGATPKPEGAPGAGQQIQKGTRIVNPATGERMVWDGAKWVPVK